MIGSSPSRLSLILNLWLKSFFKAIWGQLTFYTCLNSIRWGPSYFNHLTTTTINLIIVDHTNHICWWSSCWACPEHWGERSSNYVTTTIPTSLASLSSTIYAVGVEWYHDLVDEYSINIKVNGAFSFLKPWMKRRSRNTLCWLQLWS